MQIAFIIILAVLAIVSIFLLAEDADESAFGIVPIVIIVAFTIIIILNINGYKEGQIDAATGKLKYHLVTHPDSTKTWEKIQEDKR